MSCVSFRYKLTGFKSKISHRIYWVLTLYCTLTPALVGHRIGDIDSSEKPRTINVLGLSLNPKT